MNEILQALSAINKVEVDQSKLKSLVVPLLEHIYNKQFTNQYDDKVLELNVQLNAVQTGCNMYVRCDQIDAVSRIQQDIRALNKK